MKCINKNTYISAKSYHMAKYYKIYQNYLGYINRRVSFWKRQIERARTSTTMPGTPVGRLVCSVIYISKREREREREREERGTNFA